MERVYKTNIIELKKIMVENQLDQIGLLAEATGISRSTIGKVVSGSIQPSSDVIDVLIQALKLTPAQAGEIFFCNNTFAKRKAQS